MDLGLKGKVALITGTGSQIGFGKGIALSLAKEGCDVIGFDVNLPGAEQTAAEVKALGRKSVAYKVDVSNRAEVDTAVKKVIAEFGKIDILVNNSAVGVPWRPTIEMSRADMDKAINVNFFGQFNMVQAVAPYMMQHKYGKIVNFSGGQGGPHDSAYSASKGAVDGWTKSIARDLVNHGVIVNLYLPGAGETGLGIGNVPPGMFENLKAHNALKRLCSPEDVGAAITFMVSDKNGFMVGQLVQSNI
jgi:NAD(P)-dependent dehydrogenase (short-subunit alcohol dehydrogenase family)